MADLNLPSTSGSTISSKATNRIPKPPIDEDDAVTLRSLEIIGKIAAMLKSETIEFVAILEKVLAVANDEKTEKRKIVYDLVENVMDSILEADVDELLTAKKHFENIFLQRKHADILIDESNLVTLHPLGKGRFSYLLLALLCQPDRENRKVTVKKSKSIEFNSLIDQELTALSQLKHKNIINLYGKCTDKPQIVLEYMDFGNFLNAAEVLKFKVDNLLRFLDNVACAMKYIIDNKYLHRNLSTENMYLNSKKQCKIGDFEFAVYVGDSDGIYVDKTSYKPNEYDMAPESVLTKTFTSASEIWSMGIVCWDVFFTVENAGKLPPSELMKKDHLTRLHLQKTQLPKSKLCPGRLHSYVVNDLLNQDASLRPNFTAIRQKLKEIASDKTS